MQLLRAKEMLARSGVFVSLSAQFVEIYDEKVCGCAFLVFDFVSDFCFVSLKGFPPDVITMTHAIYLLQATPHQDLICSIALLSIINHDKPRFSNSFPYLCISIYFNLLQGNRSSNRQACDD